jgi:hypothetical protein
MTSAELATLTTLWRFRACATADDAEPSAVDDDDRDEPEPPAVAD